MIEIYRKFHVDILYIVWFWRLDIDIVEIQEADGQKNRGSRKAAALAYAP